MATIDLSTSKDEKMESQSLDFSGDPALDDIARQLEAIDKEFSSDKFSGAEFLDKIDDLERSVVNTRVEDYVTGFMDDASGELLTVSGLNKEAIANIEESRQKEKERSQLAKDAHARLLEDVVARRKEALKAIDEARRRAEEYVKKQSEHEKLNIRKAFLRAEKSLIAALKGRKGEVKKYYGDLQYSTAQFMGHEGRVYRVEWSQAPQPLRFKIHHLSCNKERLASGRYVLTVTLLDRLGGHVLRWSNTRDRNLFGVTGEVLRKPDDGWHTMIKQSIETVCPPEKSLLASMVFVWELFLLRGSSNAVDRMWLSYRIYSCEACQKGRLDGVCIRQWLQICLLSKENLSCQCSEVLIDMTLFFTRTTQLLQTILRNGSGIYILRVRDCHDMPVARKSLKWNCNILVRCLVCLSEWKLRLLYPRMQLMCLQH
eukprot:m.130285 g.130285  ORF g.130285 m.130285 type:complete len:429 (+) comp14600_c0_seq7:198-1484(+)